MPREQQDYSTTNTQVLSSKVLGSAKQSTFNLSPERQEKDVPLLNNPVYREKLGKKKLSFFDCPNPFRKRIVEPDKLVTFRYVPCLEAKCPVCGLLQALIFRAEVDERLASDDFADATFFFATFGLDRSGNNKSLTQAEKHSADFAVMMYALNAAKKDVERGSAGYTRHGKSRRFYRPFTIAKVSAKDLGDMNRPHLHVLLAVKPIGPDESGPDLKTFAKHLFARYNYHVAAALQRRKEALGFGSMWLQRCRDVRTSTTYLVLANSRHWKYGYRFPRGTRRMSRSPILRSEKPKKTA